MPELEFLNLCEELGEPLDSDSPSLAVENGQPKVPHFDAERRVLTFGGATVRFQVGPGGNTSIPILRSFQDQGWSEEIKFPIAVQEAKDMHEIRRRLRNRTIKKLGIDFSVDFHRRNISWRSIH